VGTDWCKVYDIRDTPLIPLDGDCVDEECLEVCPPMTGKVAICWGGPFEEGVVDRECYKEGYYVSLYDPQECLDECTVSPWLPLQWRDCEGNIYPLTEGPPNKVWDIGVHVLDAALRYKVEVGCTEDCMDVTGGSDELLVSVYSPPYDEDCVDSDCILEYVPVASGRWVDGTWEVTPIQQPVIAYEHVLHLPHEYADSDCIDTDCLRDTFPVIITRYMGSCSVDILQYLIEGAPLQCRQVINTYGIWGGFSWPVCEEPHREAEIILSKACVMCGIQVHEGFSYRYGATDIEYYIRGISNGKAVYVVDIGYLHPTCYEPMWVETWLPLYEGGKFRGQYPLPEGTTPFLRVREVTYSRDKTILHHIEYGRPTLGRTRTKALLYHNSTDGAVDVEELSATLTLLMMAPCRVWGECQTVQGEGPDPYLSPLVLDNLLLLVSLLDRGEVILPDITTGTTCAVGMGTVPNSSYEPTNRLGSIPAVVTTYSTYDLIYNDALYGREVMHPIEEGVLVNICMDEYWDDDYIFNDNTLDLYECTNDCIDTWDIKEVLPSRRVSNRAMGWLLLALTTWRHGMGPNTDIDKGIRLVTDYLVGEVSRGGLLGQGWTHADTYRESVRVENITTSTNAVAYIALMKVYDLYRSSKVLSTLVRLQEGMLEHLWDAQLKVFLHGISEVPHASLDSILHGLWLGHTLNRAEVVEGALSSLQLRTRPISMEPSRPVWDITTSLGCLMVARPTRVINCETLPVYHEVLTSMEIIKKVTRCGVRYIDPYTNTVMVGDVDRLGYLRMLLDGLSTISEVKQYTVPYLPLLDDYRRLWGRHLEEERHNIPSYCYAQCLYECEGTTPTTMWGHEFMEVQSGHEVDVALFHKAFLRSKLPFSVPVEYGWPSLESLSNKVGTILDHWAHELSIVYGAILRGKRGASVSSAVSTQLDEYWPIVSRGPMEVDSSLRARVRDRLSRVVDSTKRGLEALTGGVVKEPRIWGTQGLDAITRFHSTGARYHGGDNVYPSFTLESSSIIGRDVVSEVREVKAYGVLDNYMGNAFMQCAWGNPQVIGSIVIGGDPHIYAVYPCCDTLHPCVRVRVDLYLNGLYPYPLYAGIGPDGEWFVSRMHSERTRWMFRPWQLSMQVVVPIGYIGLLNEDIGSIGNG
jgi:hypothetical protein